VSYLVIEYKERRDTGCPEFMDKFLVKYDKHTVQVNEATFVSWFNDKFAFGFIEGSIDSVQVFLEPLRE